jgi:hypothetical protein
VPRGSGLGALPWPGYALFVRAAASSPITRRAAVRLMSGRANNFPPAARHATREARRALADERAAKLAPLIKALQAAGVTS